MAEVVPIDQRDPAQAIRELHDCITAINASMQALAQMFPGTTAILGIARGEPVGALAFARSREANHCTPAAMEGAQALAKIVATLPDELLQDVFRIELDLAAKIRALQAEAEKACEAALAAAETR
jgi:hypothetical protein